MFLQGQKKPHVLHLMLNFTGRHEWLRICRSRFATRKTAQFWRESGIQVKQTSVCFICINIRHELSRRSFTLLRTPLNLVWLIGPQDELLTHWLYWHLKLLWSDQDACEYQVCKASLGNSSVPGRFSAQRTKKPPAFTPFTVDPAWAVTTDSRCCEKKQNTCTYFWCLASGEPQHRDLSRHIRHKATSSTCHCLY